MRIVNVLLVALFVTACNDTTSKFEATETTESLLVKNREATEKLYSEANKFYEQVDVQGAKSLLIKAIEVNDVYSKELLGIILLKEPKVMDVKRGFSLISEAADDGLASAQFYLGSCLYDDGCSLPENKVLSAYYLTQALNNGEGGAQMLLGFLDEEIGDTAIDQKTYAVELNRYIEQLN
ncbi:tetratricopeptide repeat protein [Vibrio diabolicus]|uniref:tetratricopeptide repeat protein n=1 Tax=Vibrio diabolicus TaxID=50719 RepID=UPI003752C376